MPQYTGGKISYSRTVQPVQYESKKAEVEISFVIDPDEDEKEALRVIGEMVEERALAMVGLRVRRKGKEEGDDDAGEK